MYLIGRKFSNSDASRAAKESLETVGLEESMHKPADTLSGGMKRKMFVSIALASNADLVFLGFHPYLSRESIKKLVDRAFLYNLSPVLQKYLIREFFCLLHVVRGQEYVSTKFLYC